jgi:hypothetical protein
LDKARRVKELELAKKKKLQEEEQKLKEEKAKAEQKYKELQIMVFVSKIEQVFSLERRKSMRSVFTSLVKYNILIKEKQRKVCVRVSGRLRV